MLISKEIIIIKTEEHDLIDTFLLYEMLAKIIGNVSLMT